MRNLDLAPTLLIFLKLILCTVYRLTFSIFFSCIKHTHTLVCSYTSSKGVQDEVMVQTVPPLSRKNYFVHELHGTRQLSCSLFYMFTFPFLQREESYECRLWEHGSVGEYLHVFSLDRAVLRSSRIQCGAFSWGPPHGPHSPYSHDGKCACGAACEVRRQEIVGGSVMTFLPAAFGSCLWAGPSGTVQ